MQSYLTLVRRELAGYFLSLSGYIIIAATTFLVGQGFIVLIDTLGDDPSPLPVTELFYIGQSFWLIIILATPVITMRLFALERYSGTFETLMTAPVRDLSVVLAKFSAALAFYLVMWLPMLACLFVVQHYARQSGALEPSTLAGLYLGLALIGGLFLSLGCFASAITRSQTVAAMLTLMLGVSVFALGYLARDAGATASWQAQLLSRFAFFEQMHDFARGVVDTRAVVLYASLTCFFLFLTLRAVESRRWR
jgi:ABC-2 type transport system permease protein